MSMSKKELLIVLICSAVLTLSLKYNDIVPFDGGSGWGDQGQMVWNLWIVNESMSNGLNPYTTNMVYFPHKANLSKHTLALGYFPIAFAVKIFLNKNTLYPFISFRIIIFISFTLLIFCAYLVLREVGFNPLESSIPAVAYAFCCFYRLHTLHLNHISGFFIPLIAYFVIRFFKNPTISRSVIPAFLLGYAIYFSEFSLFIYLSLFFYLTLLLLFKEGREHFVQKYLLVKKKLFFIPFLVFAITVLPFLVNWFSFGDMLKPSPQDINFYSSNLLGFFIPTPGNSPLYGSIFSSIDSKMIGMRGYEIFLGFPILLCSFFFLFKKKKKIFIKITFLLTLIFFVFSLGPFLKIYSMETGIPMPFYFLMKTPPFELFRTPVRFVVMGMFFLVFIAASGIRELSKILSKFINKNAVKAFILFVFAWTIAEGYAPGRKSPTFMPPEELKEIIDGPILNLPLKMDDGYAAALQTIHKQPIGTGYLARITKEQLEYFQTLNDKLDDPDYLIKMGFKNIIIADYIPYFLEHSFSKSSLNVVYLRNYAGVYFKNKIVAKLGEIKPIRTPWNDDGNYILETDDDLFHAFTKIVKPGKLEIQADNNDQYQIRFFIDDEYIDTIVVPSSHRGMGLQWRSLELTPKLSQKGFNRLSISPIAGDGLYSISCLIFLE